MNKSGAFLLSLLTLGVGAAGGYYAATMGGSPVQKTQEAASGAERKPLFYRNPMNPAVTSPVPVKDEMGMDYVPVYADEALAKPARKALFYRNPMNPDVTSPVPAKDEMGMDYVPVYAAAGTGAAKAPAGTVTIDPVTVQNIGVRTAKVKVTDLTRAIRAVGRVTYDEERVTRLHPKVEGWVDKLFVDKTGQQVRKDTMLLGIYSPQLVATEQEYLLALSNRETLKNSSFVDIRQGADDLVQSARERLQLLDVPAHQLRKLERTRKVMKYLHIHSPFKGVVIKLGVREGQYVTPQTELYMLADLSRIWVYADIYEDDLPWVKVGDRAVMEVGGVPGKRFVGTVSYIYPFVESSTRTTRVRLEFDNPGFELKPEMFANVTIDASPQRNAVVVPSEAIIRSGTHNEVFLARGNGKFEPRIVTLGVSSQGLTQILNGLKAGDEVVTSSQFLIDSESSLREATEKMLEAGRPPAPGKQQGSGQGKTAGEAMRMDPATDTTHKTVEKPL